MFNCFFENPAYGYALFTHCIPGAALVVRRGQLEPQPARGRDLLEAGDGAAEAGVGHGQPLPHVLDTQPHLQRQGVSR